MDQARFRGVGTDWPAVALWALVPLTIAAGFVSAAATPDWEATDWLGGLLLVIPFEFARTMVFSLLGDTYATYRGPRQAVLSFLLSMLILLVVSAAIGMWVVGVREFFAWLARPESIPLLAVPILLVTADAVIGLYFFRGDTRRQAARIEAAADDALDWLLLIAFQAPIVLALGYGVLLLARESGHGVPAWIPSPGSEALRSFCLAYAAFYFAGKAALFGHVHLAHFNRSGRRLLSSKWVQMLIWRKRAEFATDARKEATKERKRRAVLQSAFNAGRSSAAVAE